MDLLKTRYLGLGWVGTKLLDLAWAWTYSSKPGSLTICLFDHPCIASDHPSGGYGLSLTVIFLFTKIKSLSASFHKTSECFIWLPMNGSRIKKVELGFAQLRHLRQVASFASCRSIHFLTLIKSSWSKQKRSRTKKPNLKTFRGLIPITKELNYSGMVYPQMITPRTLFFLWCSMAL